MFLTSQIRKISANIIISKSATMYYCSSAMAYGIGRACKLKKTESNLKTPQILFQHIQTRSYRYDRLNKNTDSNTTVVLPPHFDTSIKTQLNISSDASVGANDLASAWSDQITNQHGNMYVNDNDDSHSYETPQGGGVFPLLVTQYPPQPHHDLLYCLHLEIIFFSN